MTPNLENIPTNIEKNCIIFHSDFFRFLLNHFPPFGPKTAHQTAGSKSWVILHPITLLKSLSFLTTQGGAGGSPFARSLTKCNDANVGLLNLSRHISLLLHVKKVGEEEIYPSSNCTKICIRSFLAVYLMDITNNCVKTLYHHVLLENYEDHIMTVH